MTAAAAISRERGSVDRQADFDAFVVARSPALLRTAYLLTRDHALAEDLLQTALTRAWFAWDRIEGDPEPYVRRILVNTYASWWRRRWNGEHATEVLPEGSRDDFAADSSTSHDLWEALGRLTRRQRAVRRTPLLRGPDRGRGRQGARLLGRHRQVPDQQGDGPAPARPGTELEPADRPRRQARRSPDEQRTARRPRAARARRRRRGRRRPPRAGAGTGSAWTGGAVGPAGRCVAAVVVAALRGRPDRVHRRPARPAPRPGHALDGGVRPAGGVRRQSAGRRDGPDVRRRAGDAGPAGVLVPARRRRTGDAPDPAGGEGADLPPETFWEGPCSSEPTYLDLDGPGSVLPSGTTYPPEHLRLGDHRPGVCRWRGAGAERDQGQGPAVREDRCAATCGWPGIELEQTFEEMDGKTYELRRGSWSRSQVTRSSRSRCAEEDAYVLAADRLPRRTRTPPAPVSGRSGRNSGSTFVVRQMDHEDPEALNLPGAGTYRIRVTDGRTRRPPRLLASRDFAPDAALTAARCQLPVCAARTARSGVPESRTSARQNRHFGGGE